MIDRSQPELSARIDALMLSVVTLARLSGGSRFASSLTEMAQHWRDMMLMSTIPEGYLDEFDAAVRLLVRETGGRGEPTR